MAFGPSQFIERQVADVASIVEMRKEFPTIWIDIVQFGNPDLISEIGEAFGFHSLVGWGTVS